MVLLALLVSPHQEAEQFHDWAQVEQLEDGRLLSLSAAQGSLLDDSELLKKIKSAKPTAAEI